MYSEGQVSQLLREKAAEYEDKVQRKEKDFHQAVRRMEKREQDLMQQLQQAKDNETK